MSKFNITDQAPNNSVITITLEQSDYQEKYKSELQKYRNQVHLKGFRKGKTPLSVIKKMYGKGILSDIVNNMFQEKLFDFIKKEDLKIIGQPILAEGQPQLDFDPKSPEEFELQFEVGQTNEFEIPDLSNSGNFEFLKVSAETATIDEELNTARTNMGGNDLS